jgi:hypothetical protein
LKSEESGAQGGSERERERRPCVMKECVEPVGNRWKNAPNAYGCRGKKKRVDYPKPI